MGAYHGFRKPFILLFGRGATAYELQIDRLCIRYCFLHGSYWQGFFGWWQSNSLIIRRIAKRNRIDR